APATRPLHPPSLHDALPISRRAGAFALARAVDGHAARGGAIALTATRALTGARDGRARFRGAGALARNLELAARALRRGRLDIRSGGHTSGIPSLTNLGCPP